MSRFSFTLALVVAFQAAAIHAQTKVRIERADQLPSRTYSLEGTATELFNSGAQVARLAEEVKRNLRDDLDRFQIEDKATLRDHHAALANIALLERQWNEASQQLEAVRLLHDIPASRLTFGLIEQAVLNANQRQPDRWQEAFRAAYTEQIAALPYLEVHSSLKETKTSLDVLTKNYVQGIIEVLFEPAAKKGLSGELAKQLIHWKVFTEFTVPVADIAVEVLSAAIKMNTVEKPEIWNSRSVEFAASDKLAPVVIAVWDEGVDVSVFAGNLYVNERELPDNGIDDDRNGFVDDRHGIAYTLTADKTPALLRPIHLQGAALAAAQRLLKGMMDAQGNIDSPDASNFRQHVRALKANQFREFRNDIKHYIEYAHGTNVGSIAINGNPAARVLVARHMIFDFNQPPRVPTIEQAHRDASEFTETINYFKQHGVRVVNMSWKYSPREVEEELAANNAGGTADERRQLARKIYQVKADALREGIASASDILFVVGAGNDTRDNRFDEEVPAALGLSNIITVGAVDQAGDEAAFTSYGRVDLYANGYLREMTMPGGNKALGSGTSFAAPEVANLAGKLWAKYPRATVRQVRDAILNSAETKTIAENRQIKLAHPKAALGFLSKLHDGTP
jgi:hypothetical protein